MRRNLRLCDFSCTESQNCQTIKIAGDADASPAIYLGVSVEITMGFFIRTGS